MSSNGISVISADLDSDQVQICVMQVNDVRTLVGKLRGALWLGLYNHTKGEFIIGSEFEEPQIIKPGWIRTSPKDKYGDRYCEHAMAKGVYVPFQTASDLSAYPYFYSGFNRTAGRFYNYYSTSYTLVWSVGSTGSGSRRPWDDQQFTNPYVDFTQKVDDSSWTVTASRWLVGTKLHYEFICTKSSYTYKYVGTLPDYGRPQKGYGWATSLPGTSERWSKGVYGADWHLDTYSDTLSNINVTAFNYPVPISKLSEEVIASGMQPNGQPALNARLRDVMNTVPNNDVFMACSWACRSTMLLDFAWAEFFRSSYEWKDLVLPLRKVRSFRNPKTWAQLFLWFTYGVKPTMSDLKTLYSVMVNIYTKGGIMAQAKSYAREVVKYGTSYPDDLELDGITYAGKANARVRLQPALQAKGMLEGFFLLLKSLDVGINAAEIWELIPYSFVVDWFVNTGDFIGWVDTRREVSKFDIKQVITSHKWQGLLYPPDFGMEGYGAIILRAYCRKITKSLPKAPFELRLNDASGHWLEGLALLVARFG